jgi:hypothetical protein
MLLGHSNAKSTQRYAHLTMATLTESVNIVGNLLRPALLRTDLLHQDAINAVTGAK